jgi:hypothetical protein
MACICDSVNIDFNYDTEMPHYTADFSKPPDLAQLNGLDLYRSREHRSETPGSISSAGTSGSEKRKSLTPPSTSNEEHTAPPDKKRKCVQKPGQKLCHCRSEKKRRDVITRGYQALSDLVPTLGKHHYTRKYILDEAAKFIESLTEGNELLRRQLNAMKDQERDIRELFMEK